MNRMAVQQSVEEVAVIIQNILKQIQTEEPRFTCTLNKTVNGRYDGMSTATVQTTLVESSNHIRGSFHTCLKKWDLWSDHSKNWCELTLSCS